MLFMVAAMVAEMERELIPERTLDGYSDDLLLTGARQDQEIDYATYSIDGHPKRKAA